MKKTWILGIVLLAAVGCFWSGNTKVTLPPSQETDKALAKAILQNDTETVTAILDANPDKAAATNYAGETPLHIAARVKNVDIIRLLLDRGADIHALNDDDITPAEVAEENGASDEVIQMLQGG